jgi:hypothetical protein
MAGPTVLLEGGSGTIGAARKGGSAMREVVVMGKGRAVPKASLMEGTGLEATRSCKECWTSGREDVSRGNIKAYNLMGKRSCRPGPKTEVRTCNEGLTSVLHEFSDITCMSPVVMVFYRSRHALHPSSPCGSSRHARCTVRTCTGSALVSLAGCPAHCSFPGEPSHWPKHMSVGRHCLRLEKVLW